MDSPSCDPAPALKDCSDCMLKRFLNDFKKYFHYAIRSAKSTLKAEAAGSYLNWLWWILNPICFMLIYTVIFGVVFNASEDYFPIFIFIGLSMWDFFNHVVTHSVKMVKNNKGIVTKVYMPKFILLVSDMMVNAFKMAISFGVVAVMMIVWRVPVHGSILFMIPVLAVLFLITFAAGAFLLHLGVYIQDLPNIVNIAMRCVFYFTGVFYDIQKRIPAPYNYWGLRLNPLACLVTQARDALLYGRVSHLSMLLIWLAVGLILSALGVRTIYKNENGYVKVI